MSSDHKGRIQALLEHHGRSPYVSYETHVRRKVVALGRSLQHHAEIYLDVNFWLMLRNAELGTHTNPPSLELLAKLRSLVARGIAFCPISESVYVEVMKQSDERTRLATAKLVDELSQGIAITAMDIRTATELAYALHLFNGADENSLDPLETLVWTRVGSCPARWCS